MKRTSRCGTEPSLSQRATHTTRACTHYPCTPHITKTERVRTFPSVCSLRAVRPFFCKLASMDACCQQSDTNGSPCVRRAHHLSIARYAHASPLNSQTHSIDNRSMPLHFEIKFTAEYPSTGPDLRYLLPSHAHSWTSPAQPRSASTPLKMPTAPTLPIHYHFIIFTARFLER
jgi:hypothetical protein